MQIQLGAQDGRESITAVSLAWGKWWLGFDPAGDDGLGLVHADEAIPPDILPEEPVIIRMYNFEKVAAPGEIVLVSLPDGSLRVRRADDNGKHPGNLEGTALWTGRRVNRFRRSK